MKLSNINNGPIQAGMGGRVLNRAVLAMDDTANATVKTTNAIEYSVNGVIYNKAALNDQAITVTHNWQRQAVAAGYVQPAGTTAYYTLGLNAAGTVCVVQGSYAGQKLSQDPTVGIGQSVAGATWVGDGSIPDVPDGYTCFGILKVVTAGAATFTAGTTALNAANVTATAYDIGGPIPSGVL